MKTRHIASAALQIPFRYFDSTEREQQASKMRCGTFVVVLLVASFVSQSEAYWSLLSKVKTAVAKAGTWVKKNCHLNSEGVGCTFSGKRGVGNQNNTMDDACDAIDDNPTLLMGLSFDMIIDTFEAVDGGDDVLDQAEYIEFLADLEVLNHCIKKAAMDVDNES